MSSNRKKLALAVDIGGTKIDICAINSIGEVEGKITKLEVPFDDKKKADIEQIVGSISEFVTRIEKKENHFIGIGVSVCGSVDPKGEIIQMAPNLSWSNIPFKKILQQKIGLPVFMDLDTRMASLGEAKWGIAKGKNDFVWVTIGTGLGSTLWLNGKPYIGYHGYSGWIGHNTIDEINGFQCGCGRRGCLETFVSGPAITRQGLLLLDEDGTQDLKKIFSKSGGTADVIFTLAKQGHPSSIRLINSIIRLLSISLGSLVNTLDITLIIMGGGVVNHSPEIISLVKQEIPKYIVGPEMIRDLRIEKESLPNSALFGSAAAVFERIV